MPHRDNSNIINNMDAKQVNRESLIESVIKFLCLYDTRRQDYKDDGIRQNAWKIVVCEVNNISPSNCDTVLREDVNAVKKVFKNLRDRFMKMRREYKPSGNAGGVSIEPSWQFYKQLEFLAPFLKHRPTMGNLSQKLDNPSLNDIDPEETSSETFESSRTADMEAMFSVCDDSQVMTANVPPPLLQEGDVLVIDDGECTNNSIESTSANNSFQTDPIPMKRAKKKEKEKKRRRKKNKKNKKKKGNNIKAILDALESSNEFIMSANRKQDPDADELFGQSIGKELKELTDYQKSLAKLRIQQVFFTRLDGKGNLTIRKFFFIPKTYIP